MMAKQDPIFLEAVGIMKAKPNVKLLEELVAKSPLVQEAEERLAK